MVKNHSLSTGLAACAQLEFAIVAARQINLMNELLVGETCCHKEVGDQEKRPQLNLLPIEKCASPTKTQWAQT